MKLRVSVAPPMVHAGSMPLGEQWVDFYALLALSPGDYVTAEALARVGAWRHKKPASIGKEVARHLTMLKEHGLGALLGFKGKTKQWCVTLPPSEIKFEPDPRAVAAWLSSRMTSEDEDALWCEELGRVLRGWLLVQRGKASDASAVLGEAAPQLSDPGLQAWRALVEGRMAYLLNEEGDEDRLATAAGLWSKRTDAAGRAVAARLRSFVAMHYRFGDAGATKSALTKMASDLEHSGDIGSLAVILNVLALLERRALNERAALNHLSRAVCLLAISGDYQMLQAALYNWALSRRTMLKRQGSPADQITFQVLEACLLVCNESAVGGDSALAELSGAEWNLEDNNVTEARRYLAMAERIVSSTEASYDQAYFHEVRARLAKVAPDPQLSPDRDLRTAERIYRQIGDKASEGRVQEALKASKRC